LKLLKGEQMSREPAGTPRPDPLVTTTAGSGAIAADAGSPADAAAARARLLESIRDIRVTAPVTGPAMSIPTDPAPADGECLICKLLDRESAEADAIPDDEDSIALPGVLTADTSLAAPVAAFASECATRARSDGRPLDLRRAVHQVASATAALALAVIAAGVGSAAVDAFNVFATSRVDLAAAAPSGAVRGEGRADAMLVDRFAFALPGAFAGLATGLTETAARADEDEPLGRVSTVALEATLAATLQSISTAATRIATPQTPAEEPDGLSLRPTPIVTAPVPQPAARVLDPIAVLLDRPDDGASRFATRSVHPVVAAVEPQALPPAVAPTQARIINASPLNEAASSDLPDWQTEVIVADRDDYLSPAARSARAVAMRRNAYGLGVPASGVAPVGAQAPAGALLRKSETAPWYLKKLEWSPFNRPELQSR